VKEKLMDGAPAGSISACHPNGWIQTDLFTNGSIIFLVHSSNTSINTTEKHPPGYMFRPNRAIIRPHCRNRFI